MDILAADTARAGSVRVDLRAGLDAAGADNVTLRQREVHVVGPKIRKEFCVCVILMAIPLIVPKDANFRKPLSAHDEVPLVSTSRNGEGELVMEGQLKANYLPGTNRLGQGHFHHGVIFLIAVVRGNASGTL